MNNRYVYVYVDHTRPGRFTYGNVTLLCEPFYVGKGSGKRKLMHRWTKKHCHRTYRIRAIKAATGVWPDVLVLHDGLSDQEAFQLEMETIALMGRRSINSGPLVNATDGGEGCLGKPMSDDGKRKISVANKGRVRATGWNHSEEAKEKMRGKKSPQALQNMKIGRAKRPPMPEDVRKKISATLKGRPLPEATRLKMRGRVPWNKRIVAQA